MPRVVIEAPGKEKLFLGWCAPGAGGGLPAYPAEVSRNNAGVLHAIGADGAQRRGIPADVRPGLHWVVVRAGGGELRLRAIRDWVDFRTPIVAAVPRAPSNSEKKKTEVVELAPEEVRKKNADRWDRMLKNREDRRGGGPEPRPNAGKNRYEESERAADETGIKRQQKKRLKAMKREAGAIERREDDEVPDTANALLELKDEKGEGGWDNDNEELYSDDAEEKFVFDEIAEDDAGNVSVDEDDAPEGEHGGDLLSSFGRELQVLLDKGPDGANVGGSPAGGICKEDDAILQEAENEVAEEDSAEVRGRGRPRQRDSGSEIVAEGKAEGRGANGLMGEVGAPARKRRLVEKPPARGALGVPPVAPGAVAESHPVPPALQMPPSAPPLAATAPLPSESELTQRLVQRLQEGQGQCTLSEATQALGLKDRNSPLYKKALGVIKVVARTVKEAGQQRPMLVLRPEYGGPRAPD